MRPMSSIEGTKAGHEVINLCASNISTWPIIRACSTQPGGVGDQ